MSLEIFNKAKSKVDKIASIRKHQDASTVRLSTNSIGIKSYRFYSDKIYRKGKAGMNYTLLMSDGDASIIRHHASFYIFDGSGTNYNHRRIDRQLRRITEFDEALDFQLQTLYNDSELYDYYYLCLLHGTGYIGYIRKDIHHNTLNSLLKYSELIELHKDDTHYPYSLNNWLL